MLGRWPAIQVLTILFHHWMSMQGLPESYVVVLRALPYDEFRMKFRMKSKNSLKGLAAQTPQPVGLVVDVSRPRSGPTVRRCTPLRARRSWLAWGGLKAL